MRVDDFVCLGRTVPEDSKKYGRKVCMAGYSRDLRSLLRVYPLPVLTDIHQRSICSLELHRPNHDNRDESWRLMRELDGCGIAVSEKEPSNRVVQWLDDHVSPSITDLNQARRSLGIIRPVSFEWKFKDNSSSFNPEQRLLFDDWSATLPRKIAPYCRFRDQRGWHELQIREWGCFEWIRKEPDDISKLWDNLRFTRQTDFDWYFVVGNMCHHRNVWLIISVYAQKRERTLFTEFGSGVCA